MIAESETESPLIQRIKGFETVVIAAARFQDVARSPRLCSKGGGALATSGRVGLAFHRQPQPPEEK